MQNFRSYLSVGRNHILVSVRTNEPYRYPDLCEIYNKHFWHKEESLYKMADVSFWLGEIMFTVPVWGALKIKTSPFGVKRLNICFLSNITYSKKRKKEETSHLFWIIRIFRQALGLCGCVCLFIQKYDNIMGPDVIVRICQQRNKMCLTSSKIHTFPAAG